MLALFPSARVRALVRTYNPAVGLTNGLADVHVPLLVDGGPVSSLL
jgi:hypothetical protein